MKPPIDVLPLFPALNDELISFLRKLSGTDWQRQTVARKWNIKDVAAHLLDGNYRRIALNRDGWTTSVAKGAITYRELIQYLDELNADWVKAARRLSPRIIIDLLETTNKEVYDLFNGLDPFAVSTYPVSWAGEDKSFNWFDIAREYTERWLHQQQIRDAMSDNGIMNRRFYYPFLDIFMRAWPVVMDENAGEGTVVKTLITGEGGGEWFLKMVNGRWTVVTGETKDCIAEAVIDGKVAWKLFSKSIRKGDMKDGYEIRGDYKFGEKVLDMVSVMA